MDAKCGGKKPKEKKPTLEEKLLEQFMSSMSEPDKDIIKADLDKLEKAFDDSEVILGGEYTLPNGKTYKCMAFGWRQV